MHGVRDPAFIVPTLSEPLTGCEGSIVAHPVRRGEREREREREREQERATLWSEWGALAGTSLHCIALHCYSITS